MNASFAYLSQLLLLHTNVMLLGDFNIGLLKSTNFNAELRHSFDLNQFNRSPNRVTADSATLLDHVYTSMTNVSAAGAFDMNISDHVVVYFCLDTGAAKTFGDQRHLTNKIRSFKQSLLTDLRTLAKSFVSNTSPTNLLASEITTSFCNIWDQ